MRGELKKETEGTILAAQEQSLPTNNAKNEIYHLEGSSKKTGHVIRPDLVLVEKKQAKVLLIDVTVSWDSRRTSGVGKK